MIDIIPPEIGWPVAAVLWLVLAVLSRADRAARRRSVSENFHRQEQSWKR